MSLSKFGMFLFGFYTMGIFLDLCFIYYGIGSVNQRIYLTIILILVLVTLPIYREKENK